MRSLFVDSAAWIALYDDTDQYHGQAVSTWQQISAEPIALFTSDYIMDEVYTHLRRRVGLPACVAVHDLVASSSVVRVSDVTLSIRQNAWDILVRHDDKVLSFTDCTSVAMMSQLGLTEVMTFDQDFRRMGFHMIP